MRPLIIKKPTEPRVYGEVCSRGLRVGGVLADALPRTDLDAARDELPSEHGEMAERVLPDPHRDGTFQQV